MKSLISFFRSEYFEYINANKSQKEEIAKMYTYMFVVFGTIPMIALIGGSCALLQWLFS